ncbi:hypothetical protein EYR40_000212 [Pleurotus pulmonarius]|nr:hypothetical protein EYR40_000212 [Pleurotus pulmonarius]
MIRIDPNLQPNMGNGVYFKSWTGTINGSPPTGGGGGTGASYEVIEASVEVTSYQGVVDNITITNVVLDRVNAPLHLYQTNGGHSGDAPSQLKFGGLRFSNWSGTALTNKSCQDVVFEDFSVAGPPAQPPRFICQNVRDLSGLSGKTLPSPYIPNLTVRLLAAEPCNSTGSA